MAKRTLESTALLPGAELPASGAAARDVRSKRPEVEPVGNWPSADTVLSPYVRELLAYNPPNEANLYAHWRRIAIAGTNVSKAIGMNLYEDGSPVLLWMQLRGHTDDVRLPVAPEREEHMMRGIANEPIARVHYERALRTTVTRHDHTFAPGLSWVLHGCDGHALGRQNPRALAGPQHPYLVEIKCPANGPYAKIPRDYMVQMQVGMALHAMQWCDFVMYTQRRQPGDGEGTLPLLEHLVVWRVHRNAACIELIFTHLSYFIGCLRSNVPPRAAMGIPPGKHELFDAPSVSVTPVFDADVVTPKPVEPEAAATAGATNGSTADYMDVVVPG